MRLQARLGVPRGRESWRGRIIALKDVWSVAGLFLLIMGGIFFGVFTASEGGGIGAGGALLIALMRRRMTMKIFLESLLEAGRLTATMFSFGFGDLTLNQFVNIAGAPEEILAFIGGLGVGPWDVVAVILACYVVPGMIVDGSATIFLTVPIFVPVVDGLPLPVDLALKLVWWGIIVVVAVEISLITPPIGMNVFVIASMLPDISVAQVYRGIAAFFVADLFRLALFVSRNSSLDGAHADVSLPERARSARCRLLREQVGRNANHRRVLVATAPKRCAGQSESPLLLRRASCSTALRRFRGCSVVHGTRPRCPI